MIKYVKKLFKIIRIYPKNEYPAQIPSVKQRHNNPFLPQIREIMEQILNLRNIPYEYFIPILIDGTDSKHVLLTAELLGRDLNRILIFTDRPEYFEEYAENMYKEQGLIPEIFSKDSLKKTDLSSEQVCGNVILDFEEWEEFLDTPDNGKKIYIPVFKKHWESAGNLDIAVPIGYNTVIVKGRRPDEIRPFFDKFEQAFYKNE